ncbi:hypothetical protein [Streptomyces yangpuensis]
MGRLRDDCTGTRRRRKVETFRFDSRDMKDPLRDMILGAGWTWRGAVYRF